MAKVYMSSTIADLKRERRAVLDWLRAARHQAVDSYLPNSDTVRDSCLDDVDTCDLYVLILGHRYGFQPAQDNPEGLSITHLEFRRAGQSGIPRIALLRTSIPDVSLSDLADPQRLALVSAFRAEVARGVRPAEFSDLEGLIRGLSTGVQAELDKLDRSPTGRAAGHRPAGPVLRLAPRPTFLAGREDLLAELGARLAGSDDAGPPVVTLCGLGGTGKTSVALEYAHRHLAELGVAWQFAAEDAAVLAAGFGELAAQLGARVLADARGSVASVHGVLAAYQTDWLLVFDNAPDRASVEAFLPPAGRGRVLVTSRNPNWPPGQVVNVPVLETEVAAAFLVSRTGNADGQAAAGLAAELGGLPLALEQAAAYIGASGGSLVRYLESFRQRRGRLLARGEPTGYSETVATTWSLAFTQLEQSAPQAVGLLRLLACYAPEPIPVRLLLQPRPGLANGFSGDVVAILVPLLEDELAVDDAVAALRRFSLVTLAGNGLVSVHRLVQAVTLAQVSADAADQWEHAAAALVEAAIPANPELPANWQVYDVLLPHARAVLDLTSGGMGRIADYLGQSGSYPAARDLFQLIADAYGEDDAYGPEHRDTLVARANLAYWTGEAGDAAGARDQFAALLPMQDRVMGPEHPRTLADRGGLAIWTGVAGDAAGARDQFAVLRPIEERVLGPEHPDTVTTRHNLARWTGEAGDPAGARDQLAGLRPIQERVMGAEHPDTLAARRDLARWTGEAGDPAGARDQLAGLLPTYEPVLGAEHPGALLVREQLAYWTGRAGDAAGSRDHYADLLSATEQVLGPEHPKTLTIRSDLASWTGRAGDRASARNQFTDLLPVIERVLGPEHPDTLAARAHLASWTGEAGDPATALDQLTALLPVAERVLGPEHPETLATRGSLARWTGRTGDSAAALDQLTALLPVDVRVLGPEHPKTLTTRGNLASWIGEAGNAAEARDQEADLLRVAERVLGREHPHTLATRAHLASWTGEAGDPATALDQLTALLPVAERVLGPEHPDTLDIRHRLARWTGEAGDAAGARGQFTELLTLLERVLGMKHPDTWIARHELARWTELAGR